MAILEVALKIAEQMHEGQKYGDMPYMTHVNEVVRNTRLRLDGQPHRSDLNHSRALIVAALHDTLEDTELTYSHIRKFFGPIIASDVAMLTKHPLFSYEENIVRIADGNYVYAAFVKLCDNLANAAGDKSHMNEERRTKLEARYAWSIEYLTTYLNKQGFYV